MNPDFDAIKASTDIVRVIESYGVALKPQGKDHTGLCPFHDDHEPSLRVTAGKGVFRCMVCKATGNAVQFVARKEGLTLREAGFKLLGKIPGVQRGTALPTPPMSPPRPANAAELLQRVSAFYARVLTKDRAGLDYLKTRRLNDPALLETFSVGYCNGTMRQALPKEGEVIDQLKALGILNEKGNECFYGRVTVPIRDAAGNICGLYGRRLTDDQPKHLYLRGEHRGVFNGHAARNSTSLIVVEAILDAMSLHAAGFCNVVPIYGKDGWTPQHEALLGQGVTEIILALDNDEPSRQAAAALQTRLAGKVTTIHRVEWPEGVKDANAFFLSRSAADFRALLPQPSALVQEATAKEEKITLMPEGFALEIETRRYEVCALEKPGVGRLKATIKAVPSDSQLGQASRLFHIDTVDFYLARSRKTFIGEAARLFRDVPETIEGDVNRLILAAENYLVEREKGTGPLLPCAAVPDAEKLEAMRMGRNPDLVHEILRDLERFGLVGETTNKLMGYLTMTSRKMADPLALQILSGSGAGKSHLQDAVLSLCPDEELIKLTSLTDRALFYKGEDSLKHKVLAVEEEAGASGARYAIRNLISAKKLTIESTIKNNLSGRLETQVNTVYGPTAVFETTTNPDTDPETKSRFIIISVDESPEQTRAILAAQRQSHTLDGMRARHQRDSIQKKHQALQRLLRSLTVINPYEPLLTYADDRLMMRRDQPKYLNLILAVTFLHQMQRSVKHDEWLGDYIETSLDDIAVANDLAHRLFGQSLDDLSFPSRQLLRLTVDYVDRRAARENTTGDEIEFTRRELREEIKWGDTRLRTHLGELIRLEYMQPVAGRMGQTFCYRLLVEPEELNTSGRFLAGLKSVEQLRTEANLAGLNPHLAGQNGHLAPTSHPATCEVGNGVKPHGAKKNGASHPNLAAHGGEHIYVLRNGHAHAEGVR
jgi:DNA primase catalytic core